MHVQDTGAGIVQIDMPKLFNQFQKLERTASINNEGIGLGLTVVQQIVEAGGGHIIAESEGADQGSCFIFNMQMSQVKGDSI